MEGSGVSYIVGYRYLDFIFSRFGDTIAKIIFDDAGFIVVFQYDEFAI